MAFDVTFINPTIPQMAEATHTEWDLQDAIKRHKGYPSGKLFFIHTNECAIFGTEKEGTLQMDVTKPHWIIETIK
jgi:hypothetical protein